MPKKMAALLMSTSMRPKRSATARQRRRVSSSLDTSTRSKTWARSRATASPFSALMSATTTRAPSLAKRRGEGPPIPCPPPGVIANLFSSRLRAPPCGLGGSSPPRPARASAPPPPKHDHPRGARALGAAHYIERMLTAFEHRVPLVFAGGPFSNRNPFPDNDDGTPSRRRPKNAFRHFIPPTRVQELRWRAELFGSAKVPGADFNDAVLGPLTGLRAIYRQSLRRVDKTARAMHGKAFVRLEPAEQDAVFALLDSGPASVRFAPDPRRGVTFIDLLVEHTLEGCFAAPEYGGNRRLGGWKMVGGEGDDQPLRYSIFSRAKGDYRARPHPPPS